MCLFLWMESQLEISMLIRLYQKINPNFILKKSISISDITNPINESHLDLVKYDTLRHDIVFPTSNLLLASCSLLILYTFLWFCSVLIIFTSFMAVMIWLVWSACTNNRNYRRQLRLLMQQRLVCSYWLCTF